MKGFILLGLRSLTSPQTYTRNTLDVVLPIHITANTGNTATNPF